MQEPSDDPDADVPPGRTPIIAVWWSVLAGMALPVLTGAALVPFQGRAAFERGLVSVIFATVLVVVVGVVGLHARRATFIAAVAAGYATLVAGLVLGGAGAGARATITAGAIPLWAAAAAGAAAGVTAVAAAVVRAVRRKP
jgi:hypothetical protein